MYGQVLLDPAAIADGRIEGIAVFRFVLPGIPASVTDFFQRLQAVRHVDAAFAQKTGYVRPGGFDIFDMRVADQPTARAENLRRVRALRTEPAGVNADAQPFVPAADPREDLCQRFLRVVFVVEADTELLAQRGRRLRVQAARMSVHSWNAQPLTDLQCFPA